MKTSTTLWIGLGAMVLATAVLFFEAWVLGVILSWFGVSLTIWQNLVIVALANSIFKNTGGSSK